MSVELIERVIIGATPKDKNTPRKIQIVYMEKTSHKVCLETGEIYDDLTEEEMREFDGDIYEPKHIDENDGQDDFLETAKRIDKDIMLKLYSLLDEKLTVE